MCLCIVTHGMLHDRRPLICISQTNPWERYVNPHATPLPCKCGLTAGIRSWFKCDFHDCCRAVARLVRCAEPVPCRTPALYHVYEPCGDQRRASVAGAAAGAGAAAALGGDNKKKVEEEEEEEELVIAEWLAKDGSWYPLPIIDAHMGQTPAAARGTPELRRRMAGALAGLSRACAAARAAKAKLAAAERAYLAADHDICRRVLQDGECPAARARGAAAAAVAEAEARAAGRLRPLRQRLEREAAAAGQGGVAGLDYYGELDVRAGPKERRPGELPATRPKKKRSPPPPPLLLG